MFYNPLDEGKVECFLCHHQCTIKESRTGLCGVRKNIAGKLYSLVYGSAIAVNIDPVEKKPLFHFLPGSRVLSIGTAGCNFHCSHCQNFDISQHPENYINERGRQNKTPEDIVRMAKENECEAIAYTYTEPTIFYEFAYDTAMLAKQSGIRNIFVSNGYFTQEVANHMASCVDAMNIDLKAFSDKFYKEICKARLEPVLENIRRVNILGLWVEVTTLVIPGLNDDEEELRQIARFIRRIGPEIPWHISLFYPAYKLSHLPPTPEGTLSNARQIGFEEGLWYVYEGNTASKEGQSNTICHACGKIVMVRDRFSLVENWLQDGQCPYCNTPVDGNILRTDFSQPPHSPDF